MAFMPKFSVGAMLVATTMMSGCVAPDISAEISRTQTAMTAVEQPVAKLFSEREANALATQIDALIAEGRDVYVPSEGCYLIGNNEFSDAPCTVEEAFSPSDDVTRFRTAQAILQELKAYFEALSALAASDSPKAISGAAAQLMADLDALSKTSEDALPKEVNGRIQKRKTSAPMVVEFMAEQARTNAIRRAVRQGDDAVEVAVLTVIAFLRESDVVQRAGGLSEIDEAFLRVEEARDSGDQAAYAVAIKDMQATIERVEKKRNSSLEGQLIDLRLAHREMAEKVLGAASLKTVRDATKTVADIQDAIQKEDQS